MAGSKPDTPRAGRQALRVPLTRTSRARVITVLAGLYVAQAIPVYLVGAAMPAILRQQGISLVSIGSMALLMLPWVTKFLWAPVVDRFYVERFGKRKSWVVPMQTICVAIVLYLSTIDVQQQLQILFPMLMVLALASSTQDIATDGYAVEHLPPEDQALGNAVQGGSVAAGVLIGGSLSLFLHDLWGWSIALKVAAALSFLTMLPLLLQREGENLREDNSAPTAQARKPSVFQFFKRHNALMILCFALLFRLPEGLIKGVEQAFLVDFGFTLSQIGLVSGGAAAGVGLGGAAIAVLLIKRLGLEAFLWVIGISRSLCFAGYACAAQFGYSGFAFLVVLSAANTFIRYMEIVGLYSAFMRVSSLKQAGTDFTILSCANIFVYMLGSVAAGAIAQYFGYGPLFTLATCLSLLGIAASMAFFKKASISAGHPDFDASLTKLSASK
ncbi:muropeptide transporter [Pseudovibrio axinellae]|uniref:Muropeptide transporter n=1 Tax=Pseudovibrio axinellae TaxID=989403 RepID=A0A165VTY3_9HYPH|nr:MFS transporter [Pseudovibrio axinellae]KZL15439.1 muropeptide transporter [Pseudovibrio axinellae]SER56497.1 MFS transporter, PAT family, beta-lactamase induction signal transducer AmpG [Pseudovibrio axinellae]